MQNVIPLTYEVKIQIIPDGQTTQNDLQFVEICSTTFKECVHMLWKTPCTSVGTAKGHQNNEEREKKMT